MNVKIIGADRKVTNQSGANYAPTLQVATDRVKLFKLVVFVMTSAGANRVLWLFDTAAGNASTKNPDIVLVCPNGFTTTLEFASGDLFQAGLYIVSATDEPVSANAAPVTVGANNEVIMKVSYRLVP